MEESTTYQAIIEEGKSRGRVEGRADEAKSLILKIGSKRFGPAPSTISNKLNALTSLDQIEKLAERIMVATGWDDLLQGS